MLLAVIAAASLHARIADVRLVSADHESALRMTVEGRAAPVIVRRDGELTHVSVPSADLGVGFAGGRRFQWLASPDARRAHVPEALWIERGRNEVRVSLRLPPEVSIEPRQEASSIVLVFRPPRAAAPVIRAEAPPPTPEPLPTPPEPVATPAPPAVADLTPPPEPPTTSTPAPNAPDPSSAAQVAQLLGTLSPTETPAPSRDDAPADTVSEPTAPTRTPPPAEVAPPPPTPSVEVSTQDQVAQLLGTLSPDGAQTEPGPRVALGTPSPDDPEDVRRRLFPREPPRPTPAAEPAAPEANGREELRLGFVTIDPTLRVAYMDATASLLSDDTATVTDRYLELRPGLAFGTSLLRGRLKAQYEPALRAFGSFGPTQSTSHRATASLDLAADGPLQLTVSDTFSAGVLETQDVDPGGEYFFDLQRFSRNTLGVAAGHELSPRWTLKGGGRLTTVSFENPGAFFDHDTWSFDLGVEREISETLHATLGYVYDRVPDARERPQAESTAHTLQAVLTGQATPRVTAQATFGFRMQDHPLAGDGGQEYRGLVLGGSVTRSLTPDASLTLSGTRTTLLSSYDVNGFYVTNQLQTAGVVRLPYGLLLDSTIGFRWNDYHTVAQEIGAPRDDTVFEWQVGVRRALRWGSVGTSYQWQRRRSNIDRFDTTSDRLMLSFDFDVLRAAGVR